MEELLEELGVQSRLAIAGALLALLAIGYEALVWRGTPGAILLLITLVTAIGVLAMLAQVALPARLRAGLMLALVGVTFAAALRSRIALLEPAQYSVGRAVLTAEAASGGDGEEKRKASRAAPRGAAVALRAEGSEAWAQQAVAVLDGTVGAALAGADAWRIDGMVRGDGRGVTIEWKIAGPPGARSCGVTGVSAATPALAIAAFGDRIEAALRRSLRAAKAMCA